jgi:hypothetical protein
MGDEILDNSLGAIDNINVPPVHPAVVGLQGSRKQIVPGPSHSLPSRALVFKLVSLFDVLAKLDAKVLLHDHSGAKSDIWIRLYTFKLHGQGSQGVIGRIANEEGKVNQLVRIGELYQQIKVG